MGSGGNDAILASWALSLHSKSPRTKEHYLRCVGWFLEWLEANDRPKGAVGDLLAVTRQDAEGWFNDQRERGLKATTTRNRWIGLRNFYGWLLEEEEIEVSPMAKVKVPKPNPEPIRVLTDDEIRKLFKVLEGKDFLQRRDMAIVRILVATGVRLSELVAMTIAEVDLAKRVAFVPHGKGDKARFVRFDAGTAQALDRYLRVRGRHRLHDRPELWLARLGPLTTDGVPQMLKRRALEAGIDHLHPHMLRHTFSHRFLAAGGNEGDLQRLGGWENKEVMARYGSARAVDRALAAYDSIDPMGNL